jgi:hypothetical protein
VLSYLSRTIATLCGDLATMHNRSAAGPATSYDDVTGFVLEQLRKMPFFLSQPVLLGTALFGVSRLLLEGSVFYKQPQERRHLQVERWRRSKFGPNRDLIKFYAGLVVLALYSRAEIAAGKQNGNA